MKSCKNRTAVTLIEMVIVVAVIALLTSMVLQVTARISNQGKDQLLENTAAILNTALEQFQDYGYQYRGVDYAGFSFPLDCNGFNEDGIPEIQTTLENALGADVVSIEPVDTTYSHLPEYSGSEALYFFLNMIPECKKTLERIDRSLLTNKDEDGNKMKITVNGTDYPLLRIIDPWKTTLHYDYYDEDALTVSLQLKSRRAFPVITSAGPDREFGTPDDITSR